MSDAGDPAEGSVGLMERWAEGGLGAGRAGLVVRVRREARRSEGAVRPSPLTRESSSWIGLRVPLTPLPVPAGLGSPAPRRSDFVLTPTRGEGTMNWRVSSRAGLSPLPKRSRDEGRFNPASPLPLRERDRERGGTSPPILRSSIRRRPRRPPRVPYAASFGAKAGWTTAPPRVSTVALTSSSSKSTASVFFSLSTSVSTKA